MKKEEPKRDTNISLITVILLILCVLPCLTWAQSNKMDSVLCCFLNGDVVEVNANVRVQGSRWLLVWDYENDANYKAAEFHNIDLQDDPIYGYITEVQLFTLSDSVKHIFSTTKVDHKNRQLSVRLRHEHGKTKLFVGEGKKIAVPTPLTLTGSEGHTVRLQSAKAVTPKFANARVAYAIDCADSAFHTIEQLNEYLAKSKDPLEGYWEFMERDMKKKTVSLGGFYKLALVRDGQNYTLLYMDGAGDNKNGWKPLYRKGRLLATGYTDHYDLEWIDASRRIKLSGEMWVNVEAEGTVLAMHMPLISTAFKFRKIR